MSQIYSKRKSVFIAGTSLLAAAVVVLDASRLKIPYPPLLFLKIDALGVPMLLSYFLFGFPSGTITSIVSWLSISTHDPLFPFSGFMKFLAEFSTIVGVYVVLRARRPTSSSWKFVSMISGVSVRVIITAIANVILLPVFMPTFFKSYEAVVVLIPLISLFNAIQGAISIAGGFAVYEALIFRFSFLKNE